MGQLAAQPRPTHTHSPRGSRTSTARSPARFVLGVQLGDDLGGVHYVGIGVIEQAVEPLIFPDSIRQRADKSVEELLVLAALGVGPELDQQ